MMAVFYVLPVAVVFWIVITLLRVRSELQNLRQQVESLHKSSHGEFAG
jgi:hypothetical protein